VTTIKASCPTCGYLELRPAQLSLVICSNRPALSYYAFACMTCGDGIEKPADTEVMKLLVAGGVATEYWLIPAEALEQHDGALITYDDVLDFALSLDGVDLLASLVHPRVGA
jgi:hypothetical protein